VIAVVWGAVMTFGPKKSVNELEPGSSGDINQFVTAVADKIKGDGNYDKNVHILTLAMQNRFRNPFFGRDIAIKGGDSEYVYSGYVRNGNTIFALINSNEYRSGDTIDGTQCEIVSISPKRVILMEKNRKRILPIEGGM
jgi:hypothetical protein